MEICKCILHIMDTERNLFVPSDMEIDQLNDEVTPLIESKLRKVMNSSNKKQAEFQESNIEKWLFEYKTNEIDFKDCSIKIANYIFEEKRKYNIFHTSDFLFAEIKHDDVRYLIGIDNVNSPKLTHVTQSNDEFIKNDILLYKTIFSSNIMKEDRIFIVEYSNSSLQLIENPYVFQTNKIYVLQNILNCTAKPSYSETVTALTEHVENLTHKYNLDEIKTTTALKTMIKDSVLEENKINTEEIADVVFESNMLAKNEFKDEIKKSGISECLMVENVKPSKKEKTQKIKTDNGIEITIPVDFMNEREFVEFVTESDGRLTIQLKNIQSITRK